MIAPPQTARAYSLGIIKQSIAVCILHDVAAVIWGGVGVGKSSMIQQLAVELGLPLFDVRLSDKEPSDLGGIPVPDIAGGTVRWLVGDLLPFVGNPLPLNTAIPVLDADGSDSGNTRLSVAGDLIDDAFACILFLDEYDRCDKATENVSLQLTLDKCVNGRRLPKACAVICAGNGSSDNGTAAISDAAATRLVHFYVDVAGPNALDSWHEWADKESNGVSASLRGFAKYRAADFSGAACSFLELQKPTRRTSVTADKLAQTCDALPFGEDVIEPLVFGAIGQARGREYLAFRKLFAACPTVEEIKADPKGARIPDGEHAFGLLFALGSHLLNCNTDAQTGAEADRDLTRAIATYVSRWEDEPQAHFFKRASVSLPSIVGTKEFGGWEKDNRLAA